MHYDFLAAPPGEVESDVTDIYAQIQRLTRKKVLADKDSAKENHINLFLRKYNGYIKSQEETYKGLLSFNPEAAIQKLSRGSAIWQFKIRLARPYISRDDTPNHICDNPLRKDKVFRLPMMTATSLKGALHSTAIRILIDKKVEMTPEDFAQHRLQLTQLFGNEKGGDEDAGIAAYLNSEGGAPAAALYKEALARQTETGLLSGRLRFYPVYLDKIGIEVINPHDRQKKAGTLPIHFETADIGAEGNFTLLYVPFNLTGVSYKEVCTGVAQDFAVLSSAIRAMFLVYGFGAKTSSNFGVAEDRFTETGRLLINIPGLPELKPLATPKPRGIQQSLSLPHYLKTETQLRDEFLDAAGHLVSSEAYEAYLKSQGLKYNSSRKKLYKKAQKWWQCRSIELAKQPEPTSQSEGKSEIWVQYSFDSFTEMDEITYRLVNILREVSSDG